MIQIRARIAEGMLADRTDAFDMKLPADVALKLATRFKHLDTALIAVFDRKKAIFKEHAETNKAGQPNTVGGVAWKEGHEKEGEEYLKKHAQLNEQGNVLYHSPGIRWKDEKGEELLNELMQSPVEIALPPIKFDAVAYKMTLSQAMAILPFVEID